MLSISNGQDKADHNHKEKSSHSFRTYVTEREGERGVGEKCGEVLGLRVWRKGNPVYCWGKIDTETKENAMDSSQGIQNITTI